MRRLVALLVAMTLSACATVPEGAYYPKPGDPRTRVLAEALYRAARAASEDPQRYTFAMVQTAEVRAYSADGATFYFSDGLARQSTRVIDALVAHEVAHELLDHVGSRRALSLLGLAAHSLIVRAYTRDQELAADQRAVEILRDMDYARPRRTLADALREVAALNGPDDRGPLASEVELQERLGALEPLEPVARGR